MAKFARGNRTAALLVGTALLSQLGMAGAARADEAAPPAASTAKAADDIVVIGTRRQDRTLTNSASPVDVLSAGDLTQQPTGNMLDTIKNIVPSFTVQQNSISDASSFVRSPSLRGLPGDEVLVMMNGKRYNRSALVQVYSGGDTALSYGSQGSDISAIPAIAVKNLQILRDGATAQYGSDAIAGVLNYGFKDANHGFSVEGRYGQYYDHGDGQSYQIAANLGLPISADNGFINLSGEYNNDGGTSRGVTRAAAYNLAQSNPAITSSIPNYPGPAQIWGSSPSESFKGLVNMGYTVSDAVKLYGLFNYAWSHTDESFNYRPPITSTAVDSTGATHTLGRNGSFKPVYLTPCPASAAALGCPSGGFVQDSNTWSAANLYPGGFTPRFVGVTEELFGTLGAKGKLGDLSYDLSGTLAQNKLALSMYNSISPSFGPDTQTTFNFGTLSQKEATVDLDLSYPVSVGLASPLTLSGGFEWHKETYGQSAGDLQSYAAGPYASQTLYTYNAATNSYSQSGTASQSPAASGYGGTSPQFAGNWSQQNVAVYIDAETDITEALSVGLAGRYEHYNTFGSAVTGKFNAIYKISDALSIRGTVGNGFHAPSPGQSNVSILTTNFIAGNQVQTGTYPVNSQISQYYGAQALKPEKSLNVGLGFVAKPLPGFTLTVDGYWIKVYNRIGVSKNFSVSDADVTALPLLASVGVGGNITYFTNGYDTRTDGVDVVGTYHTHLADGSLNLTLAYNYNSSKVTYNAGVLSSDQVLDISRLTPNHRVVLSGAWSKGPWAINARENFYGSWRNDTDYPGQLFGSKFTTDLDVSYSFWDKYTFTVGAANLFNAKPDRIAASSSNPIYPVTGGTADGQVYPRNGGPFGFNGGFWYVRFKATY